MTDADKIMNPQHCGSDPADTRVRIRINLEICIRIPNHFWLRLEAMTEVCALRAQSIVSCYYNAKRRVVLRHVYTMRLYHGPSNGHVYTMRLYHGWTQQRSVCVSYVSSYQNS